MAYVDAYVLPCPQDKVAAYRRLARKAGAVWKDHGALQYMECVADDVEPGKSTSFPRAVKAKPGETVIVAFVVFRSRAARPHQCPGDGRPATGVAGPEGHAVRYEAHVLGRLQADC